MLHLLAGNGDGTTVAIEQAARVALAEQYPEDMHRLEVRVLRTSGPVTDLTSPRIVFRAKSEIPRGHTQVDVWQNGKKAGWALLYMAHFDSVLVAQTNFRTDDVIDLVDLQVAWVETTKFRGQPVKRADYASLLEKGGAFAARALRQGKALRRGDLRPPYAAETGASVTLHYERNGMRFKIIGKARKPGFVGDVIKVYVRDTDVTYRARLTAPHLAEWIETL